MLYWVGPGGVLSIYGFCARMLDVGFSRVCCLRVNVRSDQYE